MDLMKKLCGYCSRLYENRLSKNRLAEDGVRIWTCPVKNKTVERWCLACRDAFRDRRENRGPSPAYERRRPTY